MITKQLEELKQKKENINKEIDEIIQDLKSNETLTFDIWYKYANKKHYDWILTKEESSVIRKYVEDKERYSTVTVDEILECLTDNVEWCSDKENIEELEQFKKDCIRLNFGSMTIDW